ncbi:hypothetical protein JXC34_01340, partial [Candidatus Woesearchaeota archaeon]|nr:hypothetical protein [Candidatus Woesearchaeota archaeon]
SASREYCSLQELISSGIMKVRNNNLMYLEKEQITINEIGALSLIFKTIDEYGLLRFSSETLKKSSKEITSELFRKNKELRKKIDILKKLTSAFGWGILKITYKEKQVKLFLEHFPYSRFRENCLIHLIIGMLENVFICRFKAVSSGFRFSSYSMTLEKI